MRHKVGFKRLDVKESHRKALKRSLVTALFKYERIETTVVKAKAVQGMAEKMITRAKTDSVHNRRIIARDINDKAVLAKLFTDIAVRSKERAGGYTRVLKLGYRINDAAPMAVLELVDQKTDEEKKAEKENRKKAKKPAAASKPVKKEKPAADIPAETAAE